MKEMKRFIDLDVGDSIYYLKFAIHEKRYYSKYVIEYIPESYHVLSYVVSEIDKTTPYPYLKCPIFDLRNTGCIYPESMNKHSCVIHQGKERRVVFSNETLALGYAKKLALSNLVKIEKKSKKEAELFRKEYWRELNDLWIGIDTKSFSHIPLQSYAR